jgi:organic radical activating enzyme
MNKKLRLLITTKCPNNCPLCCNKNFDLDSLEGLEDLTQYDEVSITGGEPMLINVDILTRFINLLSSMKKKVYLYTSIATIDTIDMGCFSALNGITLTLHSQKDLDNFIISNKRCLERKNPLRKVSLILKYFKGMELPKDIDLSMWKVKETEWVENCPLPEGEDFKKFILF